MHLALLKNKDVSYRACDCNCSNQILHLVKQQTSPSACLLQQFLAAYCFFNL